MTYDPTNQPFLVEAQETILTRDHLIFTRRETFDEMLEDVRAAEEAGLVSDIVPLPHAVEYTPFQETFITIEEKTGFVYGLTLANRENADKGIFNMRYLGLKRRELPFGSIRLKAIPHKDLPYLPDFFYGDVLLVEPKALIKRPTILFKPKCPTLLHGYDIEELGGVDDLLPETVHTYEEQNRWHFTNQDKFSQKHWALVWQAGRFELFSPTSNWKKQQPSELPFTFKNGERIAHKYKSHFYAISSNTE